MTFFASLSCVALCAEKPPLELSADIIIFKDSTGTTYAQLGSSTLAKSLGASVGDVLWQTKDGYSDAQIINNAIRALAKRGGDPRGWIKVMGGNILIRRGVYDLGDEGIRVPWPAHIVIEGEGWELNPPEKWREVNTNAVPATYLVYFGSESALDYGVELCPETGVELRNLSFVLKEGAQFGIRIPTHMTVFLDRVAVVSEKKARTAIYVNSLAGNVAYFRNIFIKGTFQKGFWEEGDWGCVVNMHIRGKVRRPLLTSKTLIGVLIDE